MLAVYCPHCRRRMLLPLDRIEAMNRTDSGIEVRFRCLHEHRGTWTARHTIHPA